MQNKKTLLVITPFFRPSLGGAETYINELCDYFRAHNYFVNVLTYQPLIVSGVRGPKVEKSENMIIRRFWWFGYDFFHRLVKYPMLVSIYLIPYLFFHSFFWMIRNHKTVDIIDAEGLGAAFIVRVLKKVFKKKSVVSILALYNFKPGDYFSRVARWTLSGFDYMFVEKGKSGNELESIGLNKDKFVIFNQWVDQERFKPIDKLIAKEKVGWRDKFIILFIGRAIAIKGAHILLEASRKTNKNLTYVFITGISSTTQAIIEESKKKSNVIFLGEIEPGKLHLFYQAADIFCLPSIYEEGVTRVVAEANSCGVPIVASNRGSTPYVLNKSVSILIDPTVDHFARNIDYLYNNPQKLKILSDNCKLYALENFGEANVIKIYQACENLI